MVIKLFPRKVGSLVVYGVLLTQTSLRCVKRTCGIVVVITVEVREVHMSTVPILQGIVTHKTPSN